MVVSKMFQTVSICSPLIINDPIWNQRIFFNLWVQSSPTRQERFSATLGTVRPCGPVVCDEESRGKFPPFNADNSVQIVN